MGLQNPCVKEKPCGKAYDQKGEEAEASTQFKSEEPNQNGRMRKRISV